MNKRIIMQNLNILLKRRFLTHPIVDKLFSNVNLLPMNKYHQISKRLLDDTFYVQKRGREKTIMFKSVTRPVKTGHKMNVKLHSLKRPSKPTSQILDNHNRLTCFCITFTLNFINRHIQATLPVSYYSFYKVPHNNIGNYNS